MFTTVSMFFEGGKGPHFYSCYFYIYIEILDYKHGEEGVSILVNSI